MLVKATKTVTYEISIYEQLEDDPEDGMRKGIYAFVGPPDEQSEFAVGPFKSRMAARTGAVKQLERMGYTVERA